MKQKDRGANKTKRNGSKKAVGSHRLVVRKWGNSAGLRIPMAMMYAARLKVDQEVEATVDAGALIVKPTHEKKETLKSLLSQITTDNIHRPIETGAPLGKEVW